MFAAGLRLVPAQMLEAWRPEESLLRLRSERAPAPQDRAAVRIELIGRPEAATVVGTVIGVQRGAAGHSFELAPDPESLGAIRLLLAASRGEDVRFHPRPARYLVRLPATVSFWNAARILMTTFSVSEGGCGLCWSGPLPTVGQELRLRVEASPRAAVIPGVICWRESSRPNSTAGVRLTGNLATSAWPALVADLARSGVPRA
jgi:hypothetical protein